MEARSDKRRAKSKSLDFKTAIYNVEFSCDISKENALKIGKIEDTFEGAINTACTELEQSDIRLRDGCVLYRILERKVV